MMMNDLEAIRSYLCELIGEQGCGASCSSADIFYDQEDGFKFMLEGFMGPWKLGRTVQEARATLREYANMGFGLA
jgi:hypothetical protein